MTTLALSLCLIFILSGCTLHRSEGRKEFESAAPQKIATFQILACQKEEALPAPSKNEELVQSGDDWEVWKTSNEPAVFIRATQENDKGLFSCRYKFSNEASWDLLKEDFILELENNFISTHQ